MPTAPCALMDGWVHPSWFTVGPRPDALIYIYVVGVGVLGTIARRDKTSEGVEVRS